MTITEVKATNTRWEKFIYRLNHIAAWMFEVRKVGIALLILSVSTGIYGYWLTHPNEPFIWRKFIFDFYTNISTEFFSIAVTVLIIDSLYQRRQREDEKRRLIRQIGSQERTIALPALTELRAMDAIKDGSLVGVDLERANLHDVKLGHADLRRVKMDFVDLSDSLLSFANLEGADMSGANLKKTMLIGANMRRVNLVAANLKGAYLRDADLTFVKFENARFDETTQLPDGEYWTHETDMHRFTNPQHPKYWRSSLSESHAYRENRRHHNDN